MGTSDLTQAEQNALGRLSKGSDIDVNMWQDLHCKGLVERSENKRTLTEKGRTALLLVR